MADVVEVVQTNISVVTDEDKNVVEFRYYGVNERHLDETIARVTEIELTMDAVVAAVEGVGGTIGGATGPIQTQLDALEVVVAAQAADIAAEPVARAAADTALGADIAALDASLSAAIAAEPTARDAAIAVETAARIAADAAETAARTAAITAVEATVAGQASLITAIDAAQVALDAEVTALDASFTTLSGDFTTLSADVTAAEAAIAAETAARAASEAALAASIPTTESLQDMVAALLVAGSGVILTYDDGANTLTISASTTSDVNSILTELNGDAVSDDNGNLLTETV